MQLNPPLHMDKVIAILRMMPKAAIGNEEVGYSIAQVWRKLSPADFSSQKEYLEIWDRLWSNLQSRKSTADSRRDPIGYAINNPAGKLTEDLFKFLWPKDAKYGGGLPRDLTERIVTILQNALVPEIDASSVIVASRLNVLFAVDPEFTLEKVLPLFRWAESPSAAAYWSAFAWPARIGPDLFKALQPDLLHALHNEELFDDSSYNIICQMFLLASMEFRATEADVTKRVLAEIRPTGLGHVAQFIRQRVSNSRTEAATYWNQTVKPWLKQNWPRDADKKTAGISQDLIMTAVYSGDAFSDALKWLDSNHFLMQIPNASIVLRALRSSDSPTHDDFTTSSQLPENFPAEVVHLLFAVRPFNWENGDASKILDRIEQVMPQIVNDPEFIWLRDTVGTQ